MHNICSGDIFLGLEKVKNMWEEETFGFVLLSSQVGWNYRFGYVESWLILCYEIGIKVVMEELDE